MADGRAGPLDSTPLTSPAPDAAGCLAGRVRDGRELFAGLAEALESWGARAASLCLWGPVSAAATGVFDAVQGSAVVHHVEPSLSGAELLRVMAAGGRAAFTEPWSGNPLANLFREWVAYPRKRRTRGERPLRSADVAAFTRGFGKAGSIPYYLLTSISKLARGYFAGGALESADRAILRRFPFLGQLAVQRLILLCK